MYKVYSSIAEAVEIADIEIEAAAEATVQDAGEWAVKEALSTDKFKVSDTFKRATQFHRLDRFSGYVLADKPYAEYLEFGNDAKGPYIYPVRAKALHFMVGGKDVFVKKVRSHKAYNFMSDAGDKLEDRIQEIFLSHLKEE